MKSFGRCSMFMAMFLFACTTDFQGEEGDDGENDLGPETDGDGIDITDDVVDTPDVDGIDGLDAEDIGDMEDGEEIEYECVDPGDCEDGNPCNGEETCNMTLHECEDGVPPDDGFVCGEDPRSICLSESCTESTCGDGFVDTGAGESCEPPDEGACDSNCRLQCTRDDDCLDDGNPCNGEEFCDMTASLCDRRNPLEDGDLCNEDPRRICVSGTCQNSICGDGFVDTGLSEECDDGNDTQGDGCDNDCTYSCHVDADCDDGLACTSNFCDPDSHMCAPGVLPNGTLCRAAAGPCDVEEVCNGTDGACPADEFHGASQMCRASAGDCDVQENCTGTSAACPADGFEPSSTVCRGSAGVCDLAENCTGSSADCPSNQLAPSTVECRASAGICDVAENCTGTSTVCPADSFVSSGTQCRATAGICDVAEYCTGSSASCPTNAFRPATTECRGAAEICDVAENCTGSSATCPTDAFRPSSVMCRDVNGICDAAEYCTGTSAVCPADMYNTGYTCRSSAGPCDVAEVCDGTSRDCPPNLFHPSDYVCRAPAGACDAPEYCPGDGTLCPYDQYYPASRVCRPAERYCDIAEYCTGSSTACPGDVTEPYLFGVTNVSAGFGYHTCAVVGAGEVKCWGDNNDGQLGITASTTDRAAPVDVGGLPGSATQVETGGYFSCARLSDGTVYCWGRNSSGQLGNGGTTSSHVPTRVGSLTDISSICTGTSHGCARNTLGNVYCWGDNSQYQLGDNTSVSYSTTPGRVEDSVGNAISGIVEIACGYQFSCGRTGTGYVRCWGSDGYGQVGNGSPTSNVDHAEYVVRDSGLGQLGNVDSIGAGGYHACAILSLPDETRCWGLGSSGQIGNGDNITTNLYPVAVVNSSSVAVRAISAVDGGQNFTCARQSTDAMCWGYDGNGQLGDGSAGTNRNYADYVIDIGGTVSQISGGFGHTCARLTTGLLMCWGAANYGQLGLGFIDGNPHPTPALVLCE